MWLVLSTVDVLTAFDLFIQPGKLRHTPTCLVQARRVSRLKR